MPSNPVKKSGATKKAARRSSSGSIGSGALPRHPALNTPDCMVMCRMGSEEAMRLPDQVSEPTSATVLHDDYTITADANGDAVWAEAPELRRYLWTLTAGALPASPTTTVLASKYTSFTSSARTARQVCMKTQVLYIGAEMGAQGYLSCTRRSSGADINSQTIQGLHTACERQVRAHDGLTVFNTYRQDPRFEDPTAAGFMQTTFPFVVFAASGLPAGAVLKVRTVRFLEFYPKEGDLFEGETRVEPYNPASLAASSMTSTTGMLMHSDAEKGSFMKNVKEGFNAAYHVVQPMLQSYVVPRARDFLIGQAAKLAPMALLM